MPLLPRDTVVDRPTLVDRDDDENTADKNDNVDSLGSGDGPTINGIEFEQGDYAVVAAANLVSILSTAQMEGEAYKQAFITSAVQMKEMADSGIDIRPLARMSRSRGVDDVNISKSDKQTLKLATQTTTEPEVDLNVDTDDSEEEKDDEESEDSEGVEEDSDTDDEVSDDKSEQEVDSEDDE